MTRPSNGQITMDRMRSADKQNGCLAESRDEILGAEEMLLEAQFQLLTRCQASLFESLLFAGLLAKRLDRPSGSSATPA